MCLGLTVSTRVGSGSTLVLKRCGKPEMCGEAVVKEAMSGVGVLLWLFLHMGMTGS
jgi:hypothetical protein